MYMDFCNFHRNSMILPHKKRRHGAIPSRYLRYALYNAAKYVCLWNPVFAAYLAKKRAESKHYNVALSHAAKKLVRLTYAMEKSRQPYNYSRITVFLSYA